MSSSTAFDEPPEFDVGDGVVTTGPVCPVWRRVRSGSPGIVVARTADRLVVARFGNGRRVESVQPSSLRLDSASN